MPLHELISVLSWRGDLRGTNIRLSGRGHCSVTLVVSRGGGRGSSYGFISFESLLGRDPCSGCVVSGRPHQLARNGISSIGIGTPRSDVAHKSRTSVAV